MTRNDGDNPIMIDGVPASVPDATGEREEASPEADTRSKQQKSEGSYHGAGECEAGTVPPPGSPQAEAKSLSESPEQHSPIFENGFENTAAKVAAPAPDEKPTYSPQASLTGKQRRQLNLGPGGHAHVIASRAKRLVADSAGVAAEEPATRQELMRLLTGALRDKKCPYAYKSALTVTLNKLIEAEAADKAGGGCPDCARGVAAMQRGGVEEWILSSESTYQEERARAKLTEAVPAINTSTENSKSGGTDTATLNRRRALAAALITKRGS